jgi:hypothetical protein
MVGQGDTDAAEQSPRPFPVGGLLCRGGGGGRRGRHALDLGAYTRVAGGVRAPAGSLPPDAAVGSDAVADADPAIGLPPPRVQSVSSRYASAHVGT